MQRKFLILFFLISWVFCFAHEFSYSYKIYGDENDAGEQERGWVFNFANLTWGNNDFSDYAFSINFTDLQYYFKPDIVKAWVKFPILDNLQVLIGKDYYLFGAQEKNYSC